MVDARVRRPWLRWTAGVAVVIVLAGAAPASVSATTKQHAPRTRVNPGSDLVEKGPVSVPGGNCPRGSIEAQVSIQTLEYKANQPVEVRAILRNVGRAPCDYDGESNTASQSIGPCGGTSMELENTRGVDVWPGDGAYNCPMLVGKSLPPGGTVLAVGSWDQKAANGRLAPRGRYRLIVGRRLGFSIRLS